MDSLGRELRTYPSLRSLARRFGVSPSLIAQYASKHRCVERRQEAHAASLPPTTRQLIDDIGKEVTRGVRLEDMLAIVNRFLLAFERDLAAGRVRTDNASDFERLFKMREMINASLQQQGQENDQLSLQTVQRRLRRLEVQREATRPALAGVFASRDADDEDNAPPR